MSMEHPALDHSIIHGNAHGARVRIVDDDEIDQAVHTFQFLFPHEHVLHMHMGCHHTCIYTSDASAADVAAAMKQHHELEPNA
jgi:hypothetical protein